MKLNLHAHTRWSDGYLTFQELAKYSIGEKLEWLAITDHDGVEAWNPQNLRENAPYFNGGIHSANGVLQIENLNAIQGIELSCNDNGEEVHMLGLFIQRLNDEFDSYLGHTREFRWRRAHQMARLLEIPHDDLVREVGLGIPSRLHLGYLIYLKKKETDPEIRCARDAMNKYLGPDSKSYVNFDGVGVYTPEQAIQTILAVGGIPVWAHPRRTKLPLEDTFRRYQDYAQGNPFGIEAVSLKELTEMMNRFEIVTLGNDFHGYPYEPRKPLAIDVPDELMQRLLSTHKMMTK